MVHNHYVETEEKKFSCEVQQTHVQIKVTISRRGDKMKNISHL